MLHRQQAGVCDANSEDSREGIRVQTRDSDPARADEATDEPIDSQVTTCLEARPSDPDYPDRITWDSSAVTDRH